MADWFTQNAPKPAQPTTSGGDWFAQNAPQQQAAAASKVAPGTADDNLIAAFGFDPVEIKKSPRYQENLKKHGSGLSFMLTDPKRTDFAAKLADSPIGDLGMGVLDVVTGAHQLATHGLNKLGFVSDEDTKYVDLVNRITDEDYVQNVRHGNPGWFGRLVGNIAVPLPGAPAIGTGGTAVKIAKTAAQGATGAVTQPVLTGDPNNYWGEKAVQAVTGAVAAPVVSSAVRAGAKVAGKIVNAASGNLQPEAAALIEQGKKHNVRLTYGDITRNPMAQKTEVALESVPFVGTSTLRKTQHDEAQSAVKAVSDQLRAKFEAVAPGGYDDIVKAAGEGDEYARQLLDKVKVAGNDPDSVMQLGIGLSNFRTRQQAERLYDNVQQLVEKHQLDDVPLEGTQDALNWALTQAKASKIPNRKVIQLLETINKNITAGNGYGAIRQLRSDLGDEIRSYHAGNNAIIGEKGVGYLQRLRGAIEGDLEYFTDNAGVPEIQKAAREADAYYKSARAPFKDGQLAQAAVSTEPDQIFQQFIKAGKGDRAQKFYDALDPKARSAVRYQMVANAINDATDTSKDIFHPQKFYSSMEKLSEPYGVFFKGMDKFEVDGLKNVMRHIQRAGQFAENPPTGQRLIHQGLTVGAPLATGYGLAANPGATALGVSAVAATAGLAKFLLTTNAGKKFLLAGSSFKPGSPAMQKLLDRVDQQLPTWAGKAAASPEAHR